ncbi:MAG: aminoacyl--tRNA ligase-related protein, partial [Patescibacteria group bacterium]
MEKIVSLCKRRGFIFQGSEIYGGLAGTYDWGHFGVALKNNIKQNWWKKFVDSRRDMYGIDAALIMNPKVWEASGHVAGFFGTTPEGKKFNEMFKTEVGAGEEGTVSYLRPETAQGIFVNFKNTVDAFHPKLPFGMAQIGKAFRNEIAPRDFLFRQREFEQMEVEYFIRSKDWEKYFEYWREEILEWMGEIGLDMSKVHELEVPDADRAHYSKRTIDFEFDFPFGRKELFGLAYRTDFDLKNHNLDYLDEEKGEKIIPHVIEPSMGVDRAILALLLSVYEEDEKNGEVRSYLKFKPNIAPVICAVSPLLKNKPELVEYADTKVYAPLKAEFGRVAWD